METHAAGVKMGRKWVVENVHLVAVCTADTQASPGMPNVSAALSSVTPVTVYWSSPYKVTAGLNGFAFFRFPWVARFCNSDGRCRLVRWWMLDCSLVKNGVIKYLSHGQGKQGVWPSWWRCCLVLLKQYYWLRSGTATPAHLLCSGRVRKVVVESQEVLY